MTDALAYWFSEHRWMALTAVVGMLSVMAFTYEVVPRWQALLLQQSRLQDAEGRIDDVETWDTEKVRIGLQRRVLRARYEQLYVSLPPSDQMSIILSELQQVADSVRVRLTHIRPADRLRNTRYDELPLEVELQGDYQGLLAFARQIEQSAYLIKIERLSLLAPEIIPGPLHAEIGLRVIILKEE